MSTPSRLRLDPTTNLPNIKSFGELGSFLRGSDTDADTRRLSENMGELSVHIEAIISALRTSRARTTVAPMLVDFLTVLRRHRTLVVSLDVMWRGLYEYAPYLQALNNFRVLIGQWLLEGGPGSAQLQLGAEDFELVAWRTLGEGMLMIDMYEQTIALGQADQSSLGALEEPQVKRAIQWWKKLRL